MTDRELLELAAKAAGYDKDMQWDDKWGYFTDYEGWLWNPLTDDGDALRLSVKLRIDVNHSITMVVAERDDSVDDFVVGVAEGKSNDPYAATRRAIVRVAAAIGEKME